MKGRQRKAERREGKEEGGKERDEEEGMGLGKHFEFRLSLFFETIFQPFYSEEGDNLF
jgi:hypothetical protein